jgi:hypothetical protein
VDGPHPESRRAVVLAEPREALGLTDGETDEDVVPEPPDAAVSERGKVRQLGRHRLMCGDSGSAEDVDRRSHALGRTFVPWCAMNASTISSMVPCPAASMPWSSFPSCSRSFFLATTGFQVLRGRRTRRLPIR